MVAKGSRLWIPPDPVASPGFPIGRVPTYYFCHFPQKLLENEKNCALAPYRFGTADTPQPPEFLDPLAYGFFFKIPF